MCLVSQIGRGNVNEIVINPIPVPLGALRVNHIPSNKFREINGTTDLEPIQNHLLDLRRKESLGNSSSMRNVSPVVIYYPATLNPPCEAFRPSPRDSLPNDDPVVSAFVAPDRGIRATNRLARTRHRRRKSGEGSGDIHPPPPGEIICLHFHRGAAADHSRMSLLSPPFTRHE